MLRSQLTMPQVRAVLIKCSTRLAVSLSRSSQRDPLARPIGPAHHGELHTAAAARRAAG